MKVIFWIFLGIVYLMALWVVPSWMILNINPIKIGNVYVEPIDDNPFEVEIPDTAIVLDKKDGYVKYNVVHYNEVGKKSYYEESSKELNFKLYWNKGE
jgi:hypothetical protein